MSTKAFAFEMKSDSSNIYCYMKAVGKLTHEDYEKFVPSFEEFLKGIKDPKVKILADLSEFTGWELEAAWDDLKFGLSHNNEFDKIAVVSSSAFIEYAMKISSWFMKCEMKQFSDVDSALIWLNS